MDGYQMMTPMKVVVMGGWILWGFFYMSVPEKELVLNCFPFELFKL